MNLFFTQICRRFALSALLVILLAAVISFQAIAFSALDAVQTQISAVGGQYTTAAVPKETALWWRIFTSEDGKGRQRRRGQHDRRAAGHAALWRNDLHRRL